MNGSSVTQARAFENMRPALNHTGRASANMRPLLHKLVKKK